MLLRSNKLLFLAFFSDKSMFCMLPIKLNFSGILYNFTLHFLHRVDVSFQHERLMSSASCRHYKNCILNSFPQFPDLTLLTRGDLAH